MFISTAWAQGGGGGGDLFSALLPLVLIFAVFYFLLIRPQQQKMKRHREMLAAVRRGDKIITGGGVYGTCTPLCTPGVCASVQAEHTSTATMPNHPNSRLDVLDDNTLQLLCRW